MRSVVLSENAAGWPGSAERQARDAAVIRPGRLRRDGRDTEKRFGQPADCFGMRHNQQMVVGAAVQRQERVADRSARAYILGRLRAFAATRKRCTGTSRRKKQTGTGGDLGGGSIRGSFCSRASARKILADVGIDFRPQAGQVAERRDGLSSGAAATHRPGSAPRRRGFAPSARPAAVRGE